MYKIEPGTIDDFKELIGRATESGKPDYEMFKNAKISRLIYKGELIAIVGYEDLVDPDGVEFHSLAGMFRNDIKKHAKTIVAAGRQYLNTISDKPIMALADQTNPVFCRFLEFMGFEDTKQLENWEEIGTIYRVYVRL